MLLTTELVNAYTEILFNPVGYNMPFDPWQKVIVPSDSVTASHVLHEQYQTIIGRSVPKVVFYIILQNVYSKLTGKDEDGCLGYYLTVKQ